MCFFCSGDEHRARHHMIDGGFAFDNFGRLHDLLLCGGCTRQQTEGVRTRGEALSSGHGEAALSTCKADAQAGAIA